MKYEKVVWNWDVKGPTSYLSFITSSFLLLTAYLLVCILFALKQGTRQGDV